MAGNRILHVKCGTWDEVETFYQRKIRRGNLLSIKVPFSPYPGAALTLGLEMPTQIVVEIDGVVQKTSLIDGSERTWIELELVGLTAEIVQRLKALVADGRATPRPNAPMPPLRPDDVPDDEREIFLGMSNELKRLRQLPVRQVLGVESSTEPPMIKKAWLTLVRRFHPDVVAVHRSTALTHLAEEIVIHVNRAYDRIRQSLMVEGRAAAVGAGMSAPPGWLVGFDDVAGDSPGSRPRSGNTILPPTMTPAAAEPTAAGVQGGVEERARKLLSDGANLAAKEFLAGAVYEQPKNRLLRSLYYVASALAALGEGEAALAATQLEAALANDDRCHEARDLIDMLRRKPKDPIVEARKVFQ
jgi:hypothetical protein